MQNKVKKVNFFLVVGPLQQQPPPLAEWPGKKENYFLAASLMPSAINYTELLRRFCLL